MCEGAEGGTFLITLDHDGDCADDGLSRSSITKFAALGCFLGYMIIAVRWWLGASLTAPPAR